MSPPLYNSNLSVDEVNVDAIHIFDIDVIKHKKNIDDFEFD